MSGMRNSGAGPSNISSGTSNQNVKARFKWFPMYSSLFIRLLEEEVHKINYITTVTPREGKTRMKNEFHKQTGYKLVWEKFRSKHDDFKTLYTAYSRLTRRTGVAIEPGSGQIVMDAQWWKDRKRDTPSSTRLKKKPLPHIELMHKVFGPHCPVNDDMISASQLKEMGDKDVDDEVEESEEEESV